MPLISEYIAKKKISYFLNKIPKENRILEVGCGNGWVGKYLKNNGWTGYVGLDVRPPADIVGDIRDWQRLGISRESFDAIVAFEVVEHGDFFKEFYEILKPGGLLMLTSPLPHMDWFMKLLELLRLNQKRTSPHSHLIYFSGIPYFSPKAVRLIWWCSQWGIFVKQNL